MKNSILLATLLAAPSIQAEVIAFWDFNNGFEVEDETPQIVFEATAGSGTLYQQRADTDGNGKGGIVFTDPANSISSTAVEDEDDERSIAWDDQARSGDNDAEIFITIDTTNFEDLTVSFDVRGEAPDFPITLDIKFDTSPLEETSPPDVSGPVQDFAGGESTDLLNNAPFPVTEEFTRVSFDLSGVAGIEDQPFLALRLDDFADGNEQLRIDNFLVTGTAVPEPSSALLALVGLGILARRRRS